MNVKKSYIKLIVATSLSIVFSFPIHAQNGPLKAPAFTLSDINGKMVSLSDFKGKLIYLDFWASWCGPCLKEIPPSKKLQQQLKDFEEIVFINISFDHDTTRWREVVEAKKMTGIQLISPRGKESEVLKNYDVMTIPRFFIIDKNGMIIDSNAKSPGERGIGKELIEMLNRK
jgi:thiol-disulfide isomerase/thioredoxin